MEEQVREIARMQGADLVGFGSVDRFSDAPERFHPAHILPGAQSVISFAVALSYGGILAVRNRISKYPYQYEYHVVNDQLDIIAHTVANFLEREGYPSVPIPVHLRPPDGSNYFFSQRHAAVACGLGDLGWNQLFISPQFGTRQRLSCVISRARLEPDPLVKERLCDRCFTCVENCPSSAHSKEPGPVVVIGDKQVQVGTFDRSRCSVADGGSMGIWCDEEPREGRDLGHNLAGQGVHWCGYCVAFCRKGDRFDGGG